jgi:hypothetical protein
MKLSTPKTKAEWAAYRAILNCEIGMDTIGGKTVPPRNVAPSDYALYCLLCAVRDLATAALEKNSA